MKNLRTLAALAFAQSAPGRRLLVGRPESGVRDEPLEKTLSVVRFSASEVVFAEKEDERWVIGLEFKDAVQDIEGAFVVVQVKERRASRLKQ